MRRDLEEARARVAKLEASIPSPNTHERKMERLAQAREEAAGALAATKAVLREREREVRL